MDEEKKIILVDMYETKYIPSGNIVDLSGMGPCTGVVIYNPSGKEAYAGHFVDPVSDGFEKMVLSATSHFGGSRKLYSYVVGNSYERKYPGDLERTTETKNLVKKVLEEKEFDPSNIFYAWSPIDVQAFFQLDVNTSENELVIQSMITEDEFFRGDIRNFGSSFLA